MFKCKKGSFVSSEGEDDMIYDASKNTAYSNTFMGEVSKNLAYKNCRNITLIEPRPLFSKKSAYVASSDDDKDSRYSDAIAPPKKATAKTLAPPKPATANTLSPS